MLHTILSITAGYAMLCCAMYLLQERLLFHPNKALKAPADYGLSTAETLHLQTKDGVSLTAWYVKQSDPLKPMIVYFHGNAGNIGDRADKFITFINHGFGIMALSYRGYGTSEGRPTEQGLYEDARTIIVSLLGRGYKEEDLAFYGESLGSGVAVQMALEYPRARALILEAPYLSMVKLASEKYPFIPVRWLLKHQFESYRKIQQVHVPLLLFHGQLDKLIPIRHGQALFQLANNPKQSEYFQDVDHTSFDPLKLTKQMDSFLKSMQLPINSSQ